MSVNVDCQDIINVKVETFFAFAKRRLNRYFPVLNSRLSFAVLSPLQLNKFIFASTDGAQLADLIILREKYKSRDVLMLITLFDRTKNLVASLLQMKSD